jgi:hypothetical protein
LNIEGMQVVGLDIEGEYEGRDPASIFMKMTKYRSMESREKGE